METYLLGYGFALVLALLSWSDKIRDIQKETYEIENEFAKQKGENYTKIRIILSQQKGISLEKRIDALITFFKSTGSEKDLKKTIAMINKFRVLLELRVRLEYYIKLKFKMIVYLAFYFIISGVISCFISNTSYISIFNIILLKESFLAIPLIPYFIFLLFYLLFLNKIELLYREKLSDTLESF